MMSSGIKKTINQQSKVVMHFSVLLEDGTVVESTFGTEEPLGFTMGDGTLIEGFEYALLGLKAGDQQSIEIPPEEGFGFSSETDIHTMNRSDFSEDMELAAGVVINFDTPSGLEVPGTIVEVLKDSVKVDFSHPLANRTVMFNVKILEVQ